MAKKKKLPRDLIFQKEFIEDIRYWIKIDRKAALKILDMIEVINRDPFIGIGKPEPLKFLGSGVWSRRLSQEHRLVYIVSDKKIDFVQCRYHY